MAAAQPVGFVLLGLVAAAETGLLGYLVNKFEPDLYPGGRGENDTPNRMKS